MGTSVAVTAIGRDRPGIAAAVAEALFDAGANLEDCSMSILAGEFAMILIAKLDDEAHLERLENRVRTASEPLGLTVSFRRLSAQESMRKGSRGRPYTISVYGADRPGILAKITRLLAEAGVNVSDLDTHLAPGGGGAGIYTMLLEVDVPPGVDEKALEAELKRTGDALGVDVAMNTVDADVL